MKKISAILIWMTTCFLAVDGQTRKYHDALVFELVDHPKYVITREGMLVFHPDGSLDKARSTALDGFEKYEILRDKNGYPTKVITENETITFRFDDLYMMNEKHVKGAENYTLIFLRDTTGRKPSKDITTKYAGYTSGYLLTLTTKTYIGPRSKNTSDNYGVYTDTRGNWYAIWPIGEFGVDRKVDDIHDYRIIVYHQHYFKYDRNGENEMTFFDLLDKPFGLDEGHKILQQPEKAIKKALKIHKIKCDGHGFMEDNPMTFYGYKFSADYSFWAFRNKEKADHYTVSGLKKAVFTNGRKVAEDVFGFCIAELIENGIDVKVAPVTYGYKQISITALFNYKGLWRHMYNNSAKIITYY